MPTKSQNPDLAKRRAQQAKNQAITGTGATPVAGTPTTLQQAAQAAASASPGPAATGLAAPGMATQTIEARRRYRQMVWANKQNQAMDADLLRQKRAMAYNPTILTEAQRRAGGQAAGQRIAQQNATGFAREREILGAPLGVNASDNQIAEVYGGQFFNANAPKGLAVGTGASPGGGWGFGSSAADRPMERPALQTAPMVPQGPLAAPQLPESFRQQRTVNALMRRGTTPGVSRSPAGVPQSQTSFNAPAPMRPFLSQIRYPGKPGGLSQTRGGKALGRWGQRRGQALKRFYKNLTPWFRPE